MVKNGISPLLGNCTFLLLQHPPLPEKKMLKALIPGKTWDFLHDQTGDITDFTSSSTHKHSLATVCAPKHSLQKSRQKRCILRISRRLKQPRLCSENKVSAQVGQGEKIIQEKKNKVKSKCESIKGIESCMLGALGQQEREDLPCWKHVLPQHSSCPMRSPSPPWARGQKHLDPPEQWLEGI